MAPFLLVAAALVATPSAPPAQLVAQLSPCTANQLSYAFDGEDGAFDGMSQSGVLMVVRNVGPQACRMTALPRLQFQDASGKTLAAARQGPRGMHPGPVLLPVALAPGAEATSTLHWVSGDVYDGHNCIASTTVRIEAQGASAGAALRTHMCGPAGQPVPYQQPPLKTDPVLIPGR